MPGRGGGSPREPGVSSTQGTETDLGDAPKDDDLAVSTNMLHLGDDLLLRIAVLCGHDAPALARVCRGTSHVWRLLLRDPTHLAAVLTLKPHDIYQPLTSLQHVVQQGVMRTIASADATRTLLLAGADPDQWGGQPLWQAALGGRAETLKVLLLHGAHADAGLLRALLCAAAWRGHVGVVVALLQAGPLAGAAGKADALRLAATGGHAALVELLLRCGADPGAHGGVALLHAMRAGHLHIVHLLLELGSLEAGVRGRLLASAAAAGHLAAMHLLLDQGGGLVLADPSGPADAALCMAASHGQMAAMQLLLDQGASVRPGTLALAWAAVHGHIAAMELLLARGADVHSGGDFALRMACQHAQPAAAELLLAHGADACAGNELPLRLVLDGLTYWGAPSNPDYRKRFQQLQQTLLRHGADPRVISRHETEAELKAAAGRDDATAARRLLGLPTCTEAMKNSALVIAASMGAAGVVRELLGPDGGVDVRDPLGPGIEALHAAAGDANLEVVELLLAAGAGVWLSSGSRVPGMTVLARAATTDFGGGMVATLLAAGADVHAVREQALRVACYSLQPAAVRLLLEAGADPRVSDEEPLRVVMCKLAEVQQYIWLTSLPERGAKVLELLRACGVDEHVATGSSGPGPLMPGTRWAQYGEDEDDLDSEGEPSVY